MRARRARAARRFKIGFSTGVDGGSAAGRFDVVRWVVSKLDFFTSSLIENLANLSNIKILIEGRKNN